MTKEELRKEAEEWLSITDNHLNDERTHFLSESEYAEQAYLAGAEPREKQIQIDAEQIRALQKQNGELTDKVKELEAQINRAFDVIAFKRKRIAELEAQIEKMRNCANCKNYNGNEGFCILGSGYGYNCNLEKWEIK